MVGVCHEEINTAVINSSDSLLLRNYIGRKKHDKQKHRKKAYRVLENIVQSIAALPRLPRAQKLEPSLNYLMALSYSSHIAAESYTAGELTV